MTALLLFYIDDIVSIVSTSAKRDLRGRRAACRKRCQRRNLLVCTGKLWQARHVVVAVAVAVVVVAVISAQSGAFTVNFAKNGDGSQTAPAGSKVKCRLALLPLPADGTTLISPKHFLTSTLSHSSISCWQNPEVQPHRATLSGSELRALGSGLWTLPGLSFCRMHTWPRGTYLMRRPCPCNCSPLCQSEVHLQAGAAN